MGWFSEHPIRRVLAGLGGALVSIFGPSVVPTKYQPWLVALGVIVIILALVWPWLEHWPGAILREHVFWRFRLRQPRSEVVAASAEASAPAVAVASPAPTPPIAPAGPSKFDRLKARQEILTGEIEMLDRLIASGREAVAKYEESIGRFSGQKINRPRYDPLWPENMLGQAIMTFSNERMKGRQWTDGLNRPPANFEQSEPTPGSLMSVRQYFDPKHNGDFLGLHRENLVRLDAALKEADKKADEMKNELAAVKREIYEEARRISG